jgi:heat shock protein HslJ
MRQEEEFLAALASARTVTFQGSDVTLRTADDAIAVTMTPR